MQAKTAYTLQQQTVTGGKTMLGPELAFTAGAVANAMPSYSQITPSNSQTSAADDIMLMSSKRCTIRRRSIREPPRSICKAMFFGTTAILNFPPSR